MVNSSSQISSKGRVFVALARGPDALYKISIFAVGCLMAILLGIAVVNVFFRYVLEAPFFWAEEISRYVMIWIVFVASGVAFYTGEHIAMEAVIARTPPRVALILKLFILVFLMFFSILMIVYGSEVANRCRTFVSQIVGVPQFWPRLAVPVGGFIMLVFLSQRLMSRVRELRARLAGKDTQ
jgi:C4-dicarboxylate transporter DctQ subunit